MKPQLKKRWINALKIAAKINRQLKRGNFLFWDGDIITDTGRFYIKKYDYDGISWCELIFSEDKESSYSTLYFTTHPEIGNGNMDSIKEYSWQFKGIKVLEKKHIKDLNLK